MTMKYFAISTVLSTLLQTPTANSSPVAVVGGPNSPVDVVPTNYTDAEGVLLQGFLSLPPDINDGEKEDDKLPAVIILHDASGPDMYEQQRATLLAHNQNYVGFVADIFGLLTEKPAEDAPWSERGAFTGQFTNNATLFVQRINAAIDYVQSLDMVDETKVAMIGYCMGGTGVVLYLNNHQHHATEGAAMIAGAISVHPALSAQGPSPEPGSISIPSLFLTGGNDFLTGPQAMAKLETDMKMGANGTAAVAWESVRYAKINHAFSNWYSGENYDERVDARSWHSTLSFLEEEFGLREYASESPPPGPEEEVEVVEYADANDGDYPLKGYVSKPEGMAEGAVLPVVIILPHEMDDTTGPNQYEQQRATQMAHDMGYIGFVADVHSHDRNDMAADELEELYHSNTTKYISRIHAAVDHVKTMEGVDAENIAVIGFGFGGSGALYYAMMSDEAVDGGVKAIASFHGELEHVANATAAMMPADAVSSGGSSWGRQRRANDSTTQPQILIQSGVEDDDMEAIIQLEQTMITIGADYELTRFSDTHEQFTLWNDGQNRYNPRASVRSFDQLASILDEVFDAVDSPVDEETKSPVAAPSSESPTVQPTDASSSSTYVAHASFGLVFATLTMGLLETFFA